MRRIAAAVLAIFVTACGGGGGQSASVPPPPPVTFTASAGVAQKGPLILGSTITAQELAADLSPAGKQYTYQTNSDFGTFNPNSSFSSQYIGLNATGYYYDEVADAVSGGQVTLNAYADLSASSVLNVNLLTTLAYQRIQHLVSKSGLTFAAAQKQAEAEVLAALGVPDSGYGPFTTLDISKGNTGDKLLAAVSSLFVFGNTSGNLSALLASVQADIGNNGTLTSSATINTLRASAKALDAATVAANLTRKYASSGVTFTAADISNWLDQDGDGLVGRFKFQVSNAGPSSAFSFPSFVTDPSAGASVSVSAGTLAVNGAAVTGPVTLRAGDIVSVSPPAGAFPNGILAIYLLEGTTRIARVTFVDGLASLAVSPANPNLPLGTNRQLTAIGTFTDGSTADLTSSVQWSSSASGVANISATGLANAVSVGQAVIMATSGAISATDSLQVVPATLVSLAVTPASTVVGAGMSRQLTATGTYTDGTTANVTTSSTWSTSLPAVATVTAGTVTGVSPGATTISATFGGLSGTSVLTVPGQPAWYPAGGLSHARGSHQAILLTSGKVLVMGGGAHSNTVFTNQNEIYDPAADSWSSAGTTPATDRETATLLNNGKVLVAGGFDGGAQVNTVNIYDPLTQRYTPGPSMNDTRESHTATLLPDGRVLVVGGLRMDFVLARPELYDPNTNSWSLAAAMQSSRTDHTATLLPNGKVLIAGGHGQTTPRVAAAELYDPMANVWSSAGTMVSARESATATLLRDGRVLIVGGNDNAGTLTAASEIYDPTTNTWSATGDMQTGRVGHTATLMPNGKVLVAGGYSVPAGAAVSSSEIYDPPTGTWSAAPAMSTPRQGHTATLLPNSMLLVTGGQSSAQSSIYDFVLSSCELYW